MSAHTLKNKNVVIAGGAKNLGGLIARRMAEHGANVFIHYNSSATQAEAEATLQTVQAHGVNAGLYQADLSNIASIDNFVCQRQTDLGQCRHRHKYRRQGVEKTIFGHDGARI